MSAMQAIAIAPAPVSAPPPIKQKRARHSKPKVVVAAAPLSTPSSILAEVIAVVLPLLQEHERDNFEFKPGLGQKDVRAALSTVIGDYPVEEAVSLYAMVRQKIVGCACDLAFEALYETKWSLLDFISTGFGSSVNCVAARVALFHEHFNDFSDSQIVGIRYTTKIDLTHILEGEFSGDTFGRGWAHRLCTPKEIDEAEED